MHLIQEPLGKNAHHIARDSTICLEVLTMTASEQPGISKLSLAHSEQCLSQNVTLSLHPNSRLPCIHNRQQKQTCKDLQQQADVSKHMSVVVLERWSHIRILLDHCDR